MGFAISVDDLIDAGHYDGMTTGWNPINTPNYYSYFSEKKKEEKQIIKEKIRFYSDSKATGNHQAIKRTQEEIEAELIELESMRYYYRVAEKNLLMVKNNANIQSVIVADIMNGLLEFYDISCESIAEIQEEIKEKTSVEYTAIAKECNEGAIRKDIVKNIFDIISNGITNGLPLSREVFKSMVKDLERVLEILEYNDRKVKKLDVEDYFIKKCKKRIGMVVCQNCHRPLLADIPYCFNCFDGRYS